MSHKIAILGTGGTIATAHNQERGGAAPSLSASQLSDMVASYVNATLIEEEVYCLPSTFIGVPEMWGLAARVFHRLRDGLTDAVVVTHGTDTLEETAFFLQLTLPPPAPVVITGAMRIPSDPGADGTANLTSSIAVASYLTGRDDATPVVVVNEEIHIPEFATKLQSWNLGAFTSLPFGPIGIVHEHDVYLPLTLARQSPQLFPSVVRTEPPDNLPVVELIRVVAGDTAGALDAVVGRLPAGLVIEGTGGGHVPPVCVPPIKRALNNGTVVVMASRCQAGYPLRRTYEITGGERQLQDLGVAYVRLSGNKARLLLTLAFSSGWSHDEAEGLLSGWPRLDSGPPVSSSGGNQWQG